MRRGSPAAEAARCLGGVASQRQRRSGGPAAEAAQRPGGRGDAASRRRGVPFAHPRVQREAPSNQTPTVRSYNIDRSFL